MKRFAWMGALLAAALAAGLAGCGWDTGGDAENWNSSYDWVNFSGVYRGSVTTTLDPDYEPADPGSTNAHVDVYANIDGMLAHESRAEGKTSHAPVVPGSATISVNGASLADPDRDGVLTGSGSGTFNYNTGNWAIEIQPAYIDFTTNHDITVAYAYSVKGSDATGTEFGTTQVDDYSFVVHQDAQHLTVTDNTGINYYGEISKIVSASGAQNTDIGQVGTAEEANDTGKYTYYESPLPENGDAIMANFEVSNAGAKIVGTFQGAVAAGVFTDRRMDGTKITAASSDDIKATAASVAIATPTPLTEAITTATSTGATSTATQ